MHRRTLLVVGLGAAVPILTGFRPSLMAPEMDKRIASVLLADMEPDGQTQTYRRYRLLLMGQRDDPVASDLSRSAVAVLARFLPASRAKLIRAADTRRVGVLIGTHQQDIAIMGKQSAERLFFGKPPFGDIRNLPLRLVVSFGSHVLVCRKDFENSGAYLVAQALTQHKDLLSRLPSQPTGMVPIHPGSHAYFAGHEIPSDR